MSALVSRILLAILMLPVAVLVFILSIIITDRSLRGGSYSDRVHVMAAITCVVTWVFVAGYWIALWKSVVRWSAERLSFTVFATIGSAVGGLFVALLVNSIERGFGDIIGAIVAPLSWLIATTLLWRETPAERAERVRAVQKSAVVCPSCGYNLTGLKGTRCPECGTEYSLDEILAGQPGNIERDVDD